VDLKGRNMPREEDNRILCSVYQQLDNLQKDVTDVRLEIKSVASKQTDYTLPWLDKVVKKLFGNGTAGLLDEHVECKGKIKALEDSAKELKLLRVWVRNLTTTTAISIIFGLIITIWRLVIK
jgi:hypothetical protein